MTHSSSTRSVLRGRLLGSTALICLSEVRAVLVLPALICLSEVRAVLVLPPGYEDELYCPAGFCMVHKDLGPGFAGPRSAFHECFNKDTGEKTGVVPWGSKSDGAEEEKQRLLQNGHHTEDCPDDVAKQYRASLQQGPDDHQDLVPDEPPEQEVVVEPLQEVVEQEDVSIPVPDHETPPLQSWSQWLRKYRDPLVQLADNEEKGVALKWAEVWRQFREDNDLFSPSPAYRHLVYTYQPEPTLNPELRVRLTTMYRRRKGAATFLQLLDLPAGSLVLGHWKGLRENDARWLQDWENPWDLAKKGYFSFGRGIINVSDPQDLDAPDQEKQEVFQTHAPTLYRVAKGGILKEVGGKGSWFNIKKADSEIAARLESLVAETSEGKDGYIWWELQLGLFFHFQFFPLTVDDHKGKTPLDPWTPAVRPLQRVRVNVKARNPAQSGAYWLRLVDDGDAPPDTEVDHLHDMEYTLERDWAFDRDIPEAIASKVYDSTRAVLLKEKANDVETNAEEEIQRRRMLAGESSFSIQNRVVDLHSGAPDLFPDYMEKSPKKLGRTIIPNPVHYFKKSANSVKRRFAQRRLAQATQKKEAAENRSEAKIEALALKVKKLASGALSTRFSGGPAPSEVEHGDQEDIVLRPEDVEGFEVSLIQDGGLLFLPQNGNREWHNSDPFDKDRKRKFADKVKALDLGGMAFSEGPGRMKDRVPLQKAQLKIGPEDPKREGRDANAVLVDFVANIWDQFLKVLQQVANPRTTVTVLLPKLPINVSDPYKNAKSMHVEHASHPQLSRDKSLYRMLQDMPEQSSDFVRATSFPNVYLNVMTTLFSTRKRFLARSRMSPSLAGKLLNGLAGAGAGFLTVLVFLLILSLALFVFVMGWAGGALWLSWVLFFPAVSGWTMFPLFIGTAILDLTVLNPNVKQQMKLEEHWKFNGVEE
ncbi:unnamed protein product [Amoebophrya sp. A120]|nr:unnamed protein product [Amoebophrya sp. A120]|eukprot:GSA120T00016927001.1